jgi:hypothetical protein
VTLAGAAGAAGEALDRSRGGLTTKVHLRADGKYRPLSLIVTQRADCTPFEAVMDKIRVPDWGTGRPRRLPDSVGADKAYGNGLIRSYLRRRGIRRPDRRFLGTNVWTPGGFHRFDRFGPSPLRRHRRTSGIVARR